MYIVLVMLVHVTVLAVNTGTASEISSIIMNVFYSIALMLRISTAGSLRKFFRDQRGTEHRLQNKWAFCTTLVGVLGAVLWLNRGTMESFREISIAFWLGFQPIAGFWIMLLCLLYVYTDLAYYAFRDIETDNNFKSIYDSALTMVQLAFGANWYIVMESSVGQTYQAYYLYFISYRLLVGILFTQLIIGILVGIFQDYFHSRETIKGHVLFLCAQHAGIISVKTQEGILREGLGKLALMMVNEESESLRESRRE